VGREDLRYVYDADDSATARSDTECMSAFLNAAGGDGRAVGIQIPMSGSLAKIPIGRAMIR
jgi:hypothetical protein